MVKDLLGFKPDSSDDAVLKAWKVASTRVCQPCWELKYCPYRPLVEQFPLLPPTRATVERHNAYLRRCLETNKFGDNTPLDAERRGRFEQVLATDKPENFPESIPEEIEEMACHWFGHICPVVFSAEAFTETTDLRRSGRNISPRVLMRVARRDNYMCQECGTPLRDFKIEFDHVILIAKGGSSEEHNLRVTCFDCNREKGATFTIGLVTTRKSRTKVVQRTRNKDARR